MVLALFAPGQMRAQKPRVAVLDFKPVGEVPVDVLSAYSEKLLKALSKTKSYEEIGIADFEAILGHERFQDALDCSDVSCVADIAGTAGVDLLLTGTVMYDRASYTVLAKLINTGEGKVEAQVEHLVMGGARSLLESAEIVIAKALGTSDAVLRRRRRVKEDWLYTLIGGSIKVTANVDDAEILVDGELKGRSSQSPYVLSPGQHRLVARLDGYRPSETTVMVRKGQTTDVEVRLVKLGRIVVASQPEGAAVVVDGEEIGKTPLASGGLQPGKRNVELRLAGHVSVSEVARVADGIDTELSFVLMPVEQASTRFTKLVLGFVSVGVAAASLGTGSYFVMAANDAKQKGLRKYQDYGDAVDADTATGSHDDVVRLGEKHDTYVALGYSLIGVGALAAAFSLFEFVTIPNAGTSLGVAPAESGGALLSIKGTF